MCFCLKCFLRVIEEMTEKPDITVNIVHIEGPLKGEIQELSDAEIRIGRNFDCQVRFPGDLLIVSRDHARIIRDGNRFKLLNKSPNFTYLNGKMVGADAEAYLKSGDWLMFAQGGPKVSFLTRRGQAAPSAPTGQTAPAEAPPPRESAGSRPQRPAPRPAPKPYEPKAPAPDSGRETATPPEASAQPGQAIPLLIRYGPTLQRFKTLPVTIGKDAACDFTIDHAALSPRHAEISYRQGQYWVKDLTGRQNLFIDGRGIAVEAPLSEGNKLALTSQGPTFKFLGDGRLDEVSD